LSLESIHKQKIYMGERFERRLFSSKIGKLINANLNGTIKINLKINSNNI